MDSINGKVNNSNKMKTYAEGNNSYVSPSASNYLGKIQSSTETMDFSDTEEISEEEQARIKAARLTAAKYVGITILGCAAIVIAAPAVFSALAGSGGLAAAGGIAAEGVASGTAAGGLLTAGATEGAAGAAGLLTTGESIGLIPAATSATSALVATGTESALAPAVSGAIATTGIAETASTALAPITSTAVGAAKALGESRLYVDFVDVTDKVAPLALKSASGLLSKAGAVIAAGIGMFSISKYFNNKKSDTDTEQSLEQIDSSDVLVDEDPFAVEEPDVKDYEEVLVNEDPFADESDRISVKSSKYSNTFGTEPTFTTGYQTAYDANSGENAKSLNTTIVFDGNSVIKNFKAFDQDGNMVDVPIEINDDMSIDDVVNQAYKTSKEMGIDPSNLIANVTDQVGNPRAWVKASDIMPFNINNN